MTYESETRASEFDRVGSGRVVLDRGRTHLAKPGRERDGETRSERRPGKGPSWIRANGSNARVQRGEGEADGGLRACELASLQACEWMGWDGLGSGRVERVNG